MATYIITVDVQRNLERVMEAVEPYGRTEPYRALKRAFKLFSDEDEAEVMLTLANLDHVTGVALGEGLVSPSAFKTNLLPVGRNYTEKLGAFRVKASQDPKARSLNPWWIEPGLFPWRYDDERLGQGAIIAVVDGGVRWGHPEFQKNPDRVTRIFNYSSSFFGASNHGTACAALAAGDISGVAPLAEILDVKVFNDFGGNQSFAIILDGFDALLAWAEDPLNNPDNKTIIANVSLSGASDGLGNPFGTVVNDLQSAGVIFVAAAGNDGKDLDTNFNSWPTESTDFAIGSIHYDGRRSHFSNYGNRVRFYGFGHRVWGAGYPEGYGYQDISGTSFAAPYFCGCLATFAPGRWNPTTFQEVRSFMAEFEAHCNQGIYGRYVKTDRAEPIEGLILARSDYNPVLPGIVNVPQVNVIAKFGSPEKGVLAWKQRVTPIFGGVPAGVGAENNQIALIFEGPFFSDNGSDGPWLDPSYVPTGWTIANDRARNLSGASGAGMFVVNDSTLIEKEYWEVVVKSASTGMSVGVTKETNLPNYDEATTDIGAAGIEWFADGSLTVDGVAQTAIDTFADGDVLMLAYDTDTGDFWVGKNGTWIDDPEVDPATASTSAGDSRAAITLGQDGGAVQLLGASVHQNYSVTGYTGFDIGEEASWVIDNTYVKTDHAVLDSGRTLQNTGNGDYRYVVFSEKSLVPTDPKVYWELVLSGDPSFDGYNGVATDEFRTNDGGTNNNPAYNGTYGWRGTGDVWGPSGSRDISNYSSSYGDGDRLMLCFEPSTGKMWCGINGVWVEDPDTVTNPQIVMSSAAYWPFWQTRESGDTVERVSLSNDFLYPIPTGAVSLGSVV